MGQSTFPVPSSGSSTSTILPVNASSVILDGSLTGASTYTTTINGNGGIAYLATSYSPALITISGTAYQVPANGVVASKAFGASTSVTIAQTFAGTPSTFTASTLPSNSLWRNVAYGLVGTTPTFVAVQSSGTTAGAYSTNGTTWTASTMSSASMWNRITYGNGYYVAVQISGTTAGAYYAFPPLPVAYGIYNGATVRA